MFRCSVCDRALKSLSGTWNRNSPPEWLNLALIVPGASGFSWFYREFRVHHGLPSISSLGTQSRVDGTTFQAPIPLCPMEEKAMHEFNNLVCLDGPKERPSKSHQISATGIGPFPRVFPMLWPEHVVLCEYFSIQNLAQRFIVSERFITAPSFLTNKRWFSNN